jgi:hypothetical protein
MAERICDICGRSASELPPQEGDTPLLKMDEDGLWLCADCREIIKSEPLGEGGGGEIDEELKPLIGKAIKSCWSTPMVLSSFGIGENRQLFFNPILTH